MRILVTGRAGQVGWELARSLQPIGEVIALDRAGCDLSRPETLASVVREHRPDAIVNAAAYTAVDQAEREEALATAVNGDSPGVLAEEARRAGALLVHYSTDYVFDGRGSSPWRESDAPAPPNAYGRSKLAGERAIAQAGGDWLVLRTTWVHAARGRNFVKTMLRLGREREELKVVADQVGAPTSARLIADATALALQQALQERRAGSFRPGLYHLCASGETSWHGFAEAIFEGWRAAAPDDPLAVRRVLPIATSDYPTPAARPANSRLDCSAFAGRFGARLPHWRAGLALVLEELAAARRPD